jgi:trehalose/maltose hydrolase-like predicted phosphorylase
VGQTCNQQTSLANIIKIPKHSHDLIYTDWMLTEANFDPEQLYARETVFTIGNGYLGTRGSFEEGYPEELSATLIHGVYDDVPVIYDSVGELPECLVVGYSVIFLTEYSIIGVYQTGELSRDNLG